MVRQHFIWSRLDIRLVFLVAFILRFVIGFFVWHPDLWNHMDWGERFFQYGPSGFFSPEANVWDYTWPNQPPGTIFIFAFVYKLYKLVFQIFWWLNVHVSLFPSSLMLFFDDNLYPAMLKLPAILSDLGIGYLIYTILKNLEPRGKGNMQMARWGLVMWLANPVVWYNSAVWGQTDSLISFFCLLAFYLLLHKKFNWSILALAISFYIKISLLIFLPVYVLVLLKLRIPAKKVIIGLVGVLLVIGLITLPFSGGEPYGWLYWLFTEKILGQQLQVITANAFNVWAFLTGIHERPHSLLLGPLSYQVWGLIIFGGVYGWILRRMAKSTRPASIWWGLALTAFGSIMFLTNMHERYLYPLFPYLTILAVRHKKLVWVLVGVSVVSLLNLYNFWWVPKIPFVMAFLSFGDRLMPRVLGLVSLIFFTKLARLFQADEMG